MGRRWTVVLFLTGISFVAAGSGRSAPAVPALVYEHNGDLYAISVDGSRTVRLTSTRAPEDHPAVSRDGSKIVYANDVLGGRVVTMNVNGTRRVVVARGDVSSPSWAPDGLSIYFVRDSPPDMHGATCGSIFRVSASGRGLRRVTNAFAAPDHPHSHEEPAVSPDGASIAFSDWDACEGGTSSPRLSVVDPQGRPTRDLARLPRNGYWPNPEHSSPAWSPDSKRLAFRRNRDLAIANRDGSAERRLVKGGGYFLFIAPAWSPDRRWIAFMNDAGIFVVHPDGTGLRRLAPPRANRYDLGGWLPRLPK